MVASTKAIGQYPCLPSVYSSDVHLLLMFEDACP
jgi:hypothetical protein